MKLRIRLSLVFSILFIVLLALILLYLRSVVSQTISTTIFNVKKQMESDDRLIPARIEALLPDDTAIDRYIEGKASADKIAISLYDREMGSVIYRSDAILHKKVAVNYWYPVEQEGEIVNFVNVERPIDIGRYILEAFFTGAFLLFLGAIVVIFVLLTFYFHRSITGPIVRLNRRLAEVSLSRALPPLPSPRKDQIGDLYRYVREMEQRIHESRREQADMAGAIAHDLRTPLTSMNGFLELLHTHKEMTPQQQEEYIGLIRKKSQHMTELIQQFSVHANYELEAQSLRLTPVPLAALFENIALEYEAELSGLDHELKWQHHFQPDQLAELNEAMTRRVFANLYSNAVRYGSRDQLVVVMNGFVQGGKAVITIEDNGVGVPESELSAIFRKFYTVDKSRQSERGGTGMGLATCRRIMEQQGGSIAAFVSSYGGLGIRLEFAVS